MTITISDWTKLGSAIRDARTSQGLTQHELATAARVSRSWLAKVESGHRGAELEQVLRLLSALGLTLLLQDPADRHDPDLTTNKPQHDQSREDASLALLEAHREAAGRRRDSWNTAQQAHLP